MAAVIRNAGLYLFLLFSLVVHEFMHAFAANRLGDDSESIKDRLTLNPLKHISLWGTVILPLFLLISNSGFIIGWAKPVPVDFSKTEKPYRNLMLTSAAGPLSNIALAVIFFLVLKIIYITGAANNLAYQILLFAVFINILLFVFNILPVPPLDGSKIVLYFLPGRAKAIYMKYGPFLMIPVLLLFLSGVLNPLIVAMMKFLGSLL